MSKTLVHVISGDSAGGCLHIALRRAGIADRILAYPDHRAVGPIGNEDIKDRKKWARQNLKVAGDDSYYLPTSAQMALFWEQFHDAVEQKVIWFSRRSSSEYCNFLECLRCVDSSDQILINDITDRKIERSVDGQSTKAWRSPIGHLHPEHLIEFYGDWEPLTQGDRESYLHEWDLLRGENSAFRVLEDGKLVSAPLDYFDEQILSCVEDRWLKAARVVGFSMALNWDDEYFSDVGDLVLFSRLNHLIDEGKVLAQGDRTKMRRLEVRRAN